MKYVLSVFYSISNIQSFIYAYLHLHVGITITHFTSLSFRLLNCLLSLFIIHRLIYSGSTKGLKRKQIYFKLKERREFVIRLYPLEDGANKFFIIDVAVSIHISFSY